MRKVLLLIIFSLFFIISIENDIMTNINYRVLDESDGGSEEEEEGNQGNHTETNPEETKLISDISNVPSTRPTLLGIGKIYEPKDKEDKKLEFTIYFKKVANGIEKSVFQDYLYFILVYKKNLRNLEEYTHIIKAILKKDTLSKDIIEYQVNGTLDQNYDYFDIKPFFQFANTNLDLDNEETKKNIQENLEKEVPDVYIAQNVEFKSIKPSEYKQTFNQDNFIFFEVYEIKNFDFLSFKIKGSFNKNIELNNNTLIFNYNDYDNGYGQFVGTIEKINNQNNNYTISFKFEESVNADLNEGCFANVSSKDIIEKNRRLEDNNDYKQIYLIETTEHLLRLEKSSPVINNFGHKVASSSGLSGGTIAGIVIACVIVLIAVALAIIYFNKPSIKPPEINALEYYNSSIINTDHFNSSVQVIQE